MTVAVATRLAVVASSERFPELVRSLRALREPTLEVVELASLSGTAASADDVSVLLYDVDRLGAEGLAAHDPGWLPFGASIAPVVVLTRDGSEELALELLRAGAAEVVAWPGGSAEPVVAAARRAAARADASAAGLLDALAVGVVWKDRAGRVRGANRFVADLAGVEHPGQLVGRRDPELPWGANAARHAADDQLVMATGLALPGCRETLRAADGRRVSVETHTRPLIGAGGEISGTVRTFQEVTRGVPAASERGEAWQLVEAAGAPLLLLDAHGRIRHANARWLGATGYTLDQVVGERPSFLRSELNPIEEIERLWALLRSGRSWHGRLVSRKADGTSYVADHVIAPIVQEPGASGDGAPAAPAPDTRADLASGGFLSVEVEVAGVGFHERVAGERRVEALGRLSAGVARDFNNLLGVVVTHSDLLTHALAHGSRDREPMEDILEIRAAAESGRDLVSALLAYSRRARIKLEPTELGRAAAELLPSFRRRLPEGITLELVGDRDAPAALVDRSALRRILWSLVENARDAMPLGGPIVIAVEAAVVDDAFRTRRCWARPGLYASLRVTDQGVGIEPEALELVYDPFFSTKIADRSTGTGLGLARAYGLMKQHGGYIWAESEVGSGSSFHLLFAAHAAEPERVPAPRAGPAPESTSEGQRGLLYAEDNDALRRAGRRVLESAGFRVFAAADGQEALDLFEAHREEIHAVVSDLLMPVMGGGELYRELVERYGEVPFVLTTAHMDDGTGGAETIPDHVPYVLKPWSVSELIETVQRVLS